MAPKYRGGDDDWLDDQTKVVRQTRSNQRPKRRGLAAEATALENDQSNATVIEVYPRQCKVRLDPASPEKSDAPESSNDSGTKASEILLATYRRAKVLGHSSDNPLTWRERSPVTVGDRVLVEVSGTQTGVVRGVCVRRNCLVRPAPGKDITRSRVFHAIAANIDIVAIVASASSPEFNAGLVDRYLVATLAANIKPLLCITKVDLFASDSPGTDLDGAEEKAGKSPPWEVYRTLGVSVYEVDSKRGTGVNLVRKELEGRAVVFCGNSGVGKTSLLSQLTGRSVGKIQQISEVTGKGLHTTTVSVMIDGPEGSRWIDTPGVREFGLVGVTEADLHFYFTEFQSLPCHQKGCNHLPSSKLPDCSAEQCQRYASFLRIAESLRESDLLDLSLPHVKPNG